VLMRPLLIAKLAVLCLLGAPSTAMSACQEQSPVPGSGAAGERHHRCLRRRRDRDRAFGRGVDMPDWAGERHRRERRREGAPLYRGDVRRPARACVRPDRTALHATLIRCAEGVYRHARRPCHASRSADCVYGFVPRPLHLRSARHLHRSGAWCSCRGFWSATMSDARNQPSSATEIFGAAGFEPATPRPPSLTGFVEIVR
jgi:hypothetical protein